jgi:hypothetical protein
MKKGNAMKTTFVALALAVCSGASHAQTATATQTAPAQQEQPAPVGGTEPASDRLSDLEAMTFSCPRAGLNAAAREAARVPSQGTYQFAYFRIINDSHHAMYEVHFKSNYEGEADLRYCVAVYCQQGWDPRTKTSVTSMSNQRQRAGDTVHGAGCGQQPAPANRRLKQ